MTIVFDESDRMLIAALSANSRISMRDLSIEIGMSPPSTTERVRRLRESGVIRAFTIDIDPKALGYNLQAIVRIKPLPGKLQAIEKIIQEIPECTECNKVTGDDCFIIRLCLSSIDILDDLLAPLKNAGETNTSIIHSTPVHRRTPPLAANDGRRNRGTSD